MAAMGQLRRSVTDSVSLQRLYRPALAAGLPLQENEFSIRCLSTVVVGKSTGESSSKKPSGEDLDSFWGEEEGASRPSAAGESAEQQRKRPRNPFWEAAKLGFGLSALATAGACAYITYAYDTPTVKGWIDDSRRRLLEENPDVGQVLKDKSRSAFSHLTSPSIWPALAQSAILDVGEAYVEYRQGAEEELHKFTSPSSDKLLPDLLPNEQNVYTLVLDLEGTLVKHEWRRDRGWRTFKRPGADAFLERLSHFYELVIFSDEINMMGEQVVERLDPNHYVRFRLYRDATRYTKGKYIRDLSRLNRNPTHVMYITTDPNSSAQRENTILLPNWNSDNAQDTSLLDLLPFLEFVSTKRPPDTRAVLASYEGQDIATAFKERAKEYQRHVQERKQAGFFRFR